MDVDESQAPVKAGRCANHPLVALVGDCDVCGRPLCLTCATPVRGRVVGPECLSQVLDTAPPTRPIAVPVSRTGDLVAAVGFTVVLALSVLPWSHGLVSGPLSAWTVHWSLVAVASAAIGLGASIWAWRHPALAAAQTGLEAVAATTVGAAAVLHAQFPPSLSQPTAAPTLAVAGAAVAFVGALLKARAVRRARSGRT